MNTENTNDSNEAKRVLANRLYFYEQPFHQAKYGSWVYDGKQNFVFQFDEVENFDDKGFYLEGIKDLRKEVIFSLNSINHEPIAKLKLTIGSDPCEILNNGFLFITIRGWGDLTGTGANNFSSEKASKIQDDFANWIIYKLSPQTT